jgi:hypothetical protein
MPEVTKDNIVDYVDPDCYRMAGVQYWEEKAAYLVNKLKTNDKYQTVCIYEGMGHWGYVHRGDTNKFKVYHGEYRDARLKQNLKNIMEPYDFYHITVPEYDDCLFIGVKPDDARHSYIHIDYGWKQYRLGQVDSYEDVLESEEP